MTIEKSTANGFSKAYLGPKCKICDKQHTTEELDSSAWMQIDMSKDGINDLIWICPHCILQHSALHFTTL